MRSWWGKPSKDTKKKSNRESIIGSLHRKCIRPGSPRRRRSGSASDKESQIRADLQSPSPTSKPVVRCQSLGGKTQPQPLPLPATNFATIAHVNSCPSKPTEQAVNRSFKTSMLLPIPKAKHGKIKTYSVEGEDDLAYGSDTSDSFSDTEDPSDSRLLSPQASDYENGAKSAITSPSGVKQRDQPPFNYKKNPKERSKPTNNIKLSNQASHGSPRQRHISSNITFLQIPQPGFALSAPESSMSSPNSATGDGSGQLLWPQSRCSPEWSPLPSPRMTSPGPSSRIQSGAVTPLHPRAGGSPHESHTGWADDGKQQSHPLPLPPATISKPSHFTTSYSTGTSPKIPRSPARTENALSPGSRWKKGRLLGRGTFGDVYLGFNSDTGEMCAMKEVTLFADDAKSRESAQQLGQEITLLSRLRHPNIVQYYGSETVDDKLYIYLEYVSGGSIYKILQEYGQLGESAIRSFTQQILSGLAYLHAKNTVHRDIKGANILVDPTGWVKLADFGMAKHMTGASCPLSFKGSPYWMAPEVIKNTSGCNLAVDIWSLGCTVLEMATTKPPWSQYEGVAAMFKIGNSKELPLIPDHLSEEGKDFVMKCLKRDPRDRPSAAQLLEHPFVKNTTALERPILAAESVEGLSLVTHGIKMLGFGPSGNSQFGESPGLTHWSRSPKAVSGYSESYISRNKSSPVSPVSSPLSLAQSPQHMNNHSPISSPRAASGASTPPNGNNNGGNSSFYHHIPTKSYLPEGLLMIPRPQNTNNYNLDQKSDIFRGIVCAHLSQESVSSGASGQKFEQANSGKQNSSYEAHFVLADRVSQQLLRNPVRLDPVLDLKQNSSVPDRNSPR